MRGSGQDLPYGRGDCHAVGFGLLGEVVGTGRPRWCQAWHVEGHSVGRKKPRVLLGALPEASRGREGEPGRPWDLLGLPLEAEGPAAFLRRSFHGDAAPGGWCGGALGPPGPSSRSAVWVPRTRLSRV